MTGGLTQIFIYVKVFSSIPDESTVSAQISPEGRTPFVTYNNKNGICLD